MNLWFEWDPEKAASNLRKHRVSFETAKKVFDDPLASWRQDRVERGEQRWQTIGLVDGFLLLLVVHTTWEETDGSHVVEVIRIISARRADKSERNQYERENGKT
jgi:uncharacterized DUF497 family protein